MTHNYGASALDYARETISPYLIVTPEQLDLLVLWAAHTHVTKQFATSPRLSVRGFVPGCGKTTTLDILSDLSRQGEKMSHSTGPAIYTLIDAESPTLLIDEADNMFSATGFSRANPTLQAVLNDGYTRAGFVRAMRSGRSVKLDVFTPVAFGGIGSLPAAMSSRSIPFFMTPGVPEEVYDSTIEGVIVREAHDLIADWLKDSRAQDFVAACERRPEIPGVESPRARQISAPLISVAMLAGRDWPERAYAAIRHAFLGVSDKPQLNRFQMALIDALTVWPKEGPTFMTGQELAAKMAAMPDGLWKTLDSEGMAGARRLAALLKGVGVVAGTHRIEGVPTQSYAREDLLKAVS